MAITAAFHDSAGDISSLTTYNHTVDAVSLAADEIILAFVSNRRATSPTSLNGATSGLGLTHTTLTGQDVDLGTSGVSAHFIACTGTPDAGTTFTVNWVATPANSGVSLEKLTGVDDTTPASIDAQSDPASGTGTSVSGLSLTNVPTNGFVIAGLVRVNTVDEALGNADGWTVLDHYHLESQIVDVYYSATNDQAWAPSWTTSVPWAAVMIEVLAAAGAAVKPRHMMTLGVGR